MRPIKLSLLCSIAFTIVFINPQECAAGQPRKIIGGEVAQIKEFPAIVSVRYEDQHLCGGSLISEKHVLTAAHCVTNLVTKTGKLEYLNPKDLKVGTGSNYAPKMKYIYSAVKVYVHPGYTGNIADHQDDIAIILLNREIKKEKGQQIMKLPTRDVSPGMTGFVAGWGASDKEEVDTNPLLQNTRMEVVSNDECQNYFDTRISYCHVCAMLRTGVGFCAGDSGGPLVIDGAIAGIVSMSGDCGGDGPDIYTRVYKYIDWIKLTIKKSST